MKAPQDESTPEPEEADVSPTAPPPTAFKGQESDLPIDRGYAWVIVFACQFSNIICLGLQRAYGILFVEFLHLYSLPVGVTSLVMAVQAACTSISALLTQTVMLSLLSERQTLIIGALCGSTGIILSYFASTIYLLILTQSVLVGSANGMIMGPTMVIVGKYFRKRRSFAMAVAILGGNLGSMIMPVFTEALLEAYGVRGTLLVLGAFFLNIMVFAGLLRPLELNAASTSGKRRRRRERRELRKNDDARSTEDQLLHPAPHREKVRDGQRWSLREGGNGTGGGREGGATFHSSPHLHHPVPHPHHTSHHLLHTPSHLCISTPELSLSTQISVTTDDNSNNDDSTDVDNNAYELHLVKNVDTTIDKSDLHHLNSSRTLSEKIASRKTRGICSRFCNMFDFSLFKQRAFLLVVVSSSLAVLPASLFGMYMPAMAADRGVTGQRAALLLTVFGGCGIASRLAFGYLADVNCIPRAYLMSLLMAITCIAGMFTPLYSTYELLVFFSVMYGLFGIVFFSLMPVVVVDLMGLSNMPKTLGFVQLFQGMVGAVSHPIIGHLRDVTGQFHASYYYLSAAGLTCAFLLLFTPLVTKHKAQVTTSQEL